MAELFLNDDEEQKKVQQQQAATSPLAPDGAPQSTAPQQQTLTTSAPAAANAAGTGTPSAQGGAQTPSGSGLQNFSAFMEANKEQANELARRLATTAGERVSSDINPVFENANTQFNTLVDSNRRGPIDQTLLDRAIANPTGLTAEERNQIIGLRDATYGGPGSFADAGLRSGLDESVQGAKDYLANLGSNQGLSSALMDLYGGTAGQNRLDTMFLRNDPGARGYLQDAFGSLNTDLDTRLQTAVEAAKARSLGAGTETSTSSQALRDALTGAAGDYRGQLDANLEQRVADATARAQSVRDLLAGFTGTAAPDISDDQLMDLGINRQQYNTLSSNIAQLRAGISSPGGKGVSSGFYDTLNEYNQKWWNRDHQISAPSFYDAKAGGNIDPSLYISAADPSSFNTLNVSTPEEAARMAALYELAGLTDDTFNSGSISQAGSAPSAANLDFAGLNSNVDSMLAGARGEALAESNANQIAAARIIAQIEARQRYLEEENARRERERQDSRSCFVGNCPITMEDGSEKAINTVKVGDRVVGKDGVNNVIGIEKVALEERGLYSINGKGLPNQRRVGWITDEHPVWTNNGWKAIRNEATYFYHGLNEDEVGDLTFGDLILTNDGEVPFTSVETFAGTPDTPVYNLLLDGDHTYVANGFIVHNRDGDGGDGGGGGGF